MLTAAEVNLADRWNARWIVPPGVDPDGYGVFHFRRTFRLDAVPTKAVVHVSGDARYQLFCNGKPVCWGPARGDLNHWRYETADLAPHLRAGDNVLAAVVWNDGPHAALSQWSHRTAFLLQAGDSVHEKLMNTGPEWRVYQNPAYEPVPVPNYQPTGYYAIGPCEKFDAARCPWGWEQLGFNDASWPAAEAYRNASPRDGLDAPTRWMLVPRPIPAMEETAARFDQVRSAEGVTIPASFPANAAAWTVPAKTKAVVLLDQGHLTTGFPVLQVNGGKGATVTLEYTEALFAEMKPRRRKGNRNEVEGKTFTGYGDTFIADGQERAYLPLYWRTWRYLRMTVQTGDTPLTVNDVSSFYTGYPFQQKAEFDSGLPLHKKIMEVGWRTARLCAHETYMDCPYYEQLQYVGDTRIQGLISFYMSGDARLWRNAIEQIDSSRTPEGATLSRAPSVLQQYIPPFSLWWIGMVHDYWWYVDEPAFVRRMLPGTRAVLSFYQSYLQQNGLLRRMPWWNYVDWVQKWPRGIPPSEADMMPASVHLQLLIALQYAIDLERALGSARVADDHAAAAARLADIIESTFWTADRRLYSEDRAHREFSQHANVLAVLANVVNGEAAKDLMDRVSQDSALYPCSVYFRYYLDRAMVAAGLGDRYVDRLRTWEFMLSEGLTTFAEQDNPYTRSDCHAWSASPNIEFLRTVLGVDSAAPGFNKVRIKPHLGKLEQASGTVPHPRGPIRVSIRKGPGGLEIQASGPAGLEIAKG